MFNISDTKLTVKSRYTYSRKVEEKHKSILAEVLEIPTILYLIENIHNIYILYMVEVGVFYNLGLALMRDQG